MAGGDFVKVFACQMKGRGFRAEQGDVPGRTGPGTQPKPQPERSEGPGEGAREAAAKPLPQAWLDGHQSLAASLRAASPPAR